MPEMTTEIVGPQEKFDQRDSMFTRAAAGVETHPLVRRWIEVESPDPLLRTLMGIPREANCIMHHLMAAADGPVNPETAAIADKQALTLKIKALARFLGADLVGICRLNPAYAASHRGDEYSYETRIF